MFTYLKQSFELNVILILLLLLTMLLLGPEVNAEHSLANDISFNYNMAVVIIIIILILIFFVLEPLPIGITSLTIPFILVLLSNWTKVSPEQALSGFGNNATIAVMSMFVLSKGIQNSGAMEFIGSKIEQFTKNNEKKQIGIISSLSGIMSGAINNTPVVAAFVPMVTNLARRTRVSPSKLLIPLSYASMLGGTMTLLGTSTNILASDFSRDLINHPFGMFEFTKLGIAVFLIGLVYLLTLGHHLIPRRITYENDLIKEYGIDDYLFEIIINKNSPLVGSNIGDLAEKESDKIDIIRLIRNGEQFMEPLNVKTISAGDHLILKTKKEIVLNMEKNKGISIKKIPGNITQNKLESPEKGQELIEVVVPDKSFLVNQTINDVNFLERYNASLLGIRHGEGIQQTDLLNFKFESGDVLLLLVTKKTLHRLKNNTENFIVEEIIQEPPQYNPKQIIKALVIIAGVMGLGALNIMPISIAALGGVVAMVASNIVKPNEIYNTIDWEIVFLLAGLIPLRFAIGQTGTANYISSLLLRFAGDFPILIILMIFYLFTAVLASIISNNASVVLMIPIAVGVAQQLGANPFTFILTITFAASSSFLTPMGYQTNLMIYGPGGYKFKDFIRVGAPLQVLLTVIVPVLISFFWQLY